MLKFIKKNVVWVMLIGLVIMFSCMSPNFLTSSNFITILRQTSITGILSMGMAFVLIGGGIDLSIGRQMGLTSVIAALLIVNGGVPVGLACIIALMSNILIGVVNGVLITMTKMPPMIESLGMQFVCYGAACLITGGYPIYNLPASIKVLGQGFIGIIPICVILFIAVIIIGGFILTQTHLGRYIFAVGSNEEAAKLSGINVERNRILLYTIAGFASGIAGLILMSRVNSGQPSNGNGLEMEALIACVVGGISFAGGLGKVSGLIGGILVMGVLSNGMAVAGMSDYTQTVVEGIILIFVVAIDSLSRLNQTKYHPKTEKKS